ncbi:MULTISPECIES: hypothetical protein [Cyanophyceae]|uniref:hypothetical protein n=1 Tax=Cyanophyceae TaxID=3028117 RepID=UPI0016823AAA|nr:MULTISPECIES: hypothetical protein [Cyanophyceae]MBD1918871.1 hypothetical protein [Phormidium sp. FACHB-77]MBD2033287.1 hypothetical protein [Phormidium sp. FACHB-322]MBD2053780.1 hypothetical protein [Leptolyngbya sp. FACHB-60]
MPPTPLPLCPCDRTPSPACVTACAIPPQSRAPWEISLRHFSRQTMPSDGKKEQAKALFIQGVAIAEIERRGIASRRTIQRWMTADRQAGNDWEALLSSLPQPEPPQRPKVVSFDRPRGEAAPVRDRPSLSFTDCSTIEGTLVVIDEAIVQARVELMSPTIPQNFGAAITGLCKLIDQRQKLAPVEDTALIGLLLQRGVTPRELLAKLREAGWLNQA